MTIEYVEFDKAAAREMWERVNVQLDSFVPVQAMREGIAIVGTVDIDAIYEVTDETAVQIVVAGCELQVDPENEQLNLQAGLCISPELRAVVTVKVSRMLKDELTEAIRKCGDWIEQTNGAPEGFVGESYDPDSEGQQEEDTLTAVVDPSASDDNPY